MEKTIAIIFFLLFTVVNAQNITSATLHQYQTTTQSLEVTNSDSYDVVTENRVTRRTTSNTAVQRLNQSDMQNYSLSSNHQQHYVNGTNETNSTHLYGNSSIINSRRNNRVNHRFINQSQRANTTGLIIGAVGGALISSQWKDGRGFLFNNQPIINPVVFLPAAIRNQPQHCLYFPPYVSNVPAVLNNYAYTRYMYNYNHPLDRGSIRANPPIRNRFWRLWP